jgi:hypothetical protein
MPSRISLVNSKTSIGTASKNSSNWTSKRPSFVRDVVISAINEEQSNDSTHHSKKMKVSPPPSIKNFSEK